MPIWLKKTGDPAENPTTCQDMAGNWSFWQHLGEEVPIDHLTEYHYMYIYMYIVIFKHHIYIYYNYVCMYISI